jgi:hypothetical protein
MVPDIGTPDKDWETVLCGALAGQALQQVTYCRHQGGSNQAAQFIN